jgi:hypothetical protein
MRRFMLRGALTILVILFAGSAWAASRFVKTNGSGSACTQANPCSLFTALFGAQDGDTIYLAGGIYQATGSNPVADVWSSVVIQAGWDGTETTPPVVLPGTYNTTLDGQGARRAVHFNTGAEAAVLVGLSIQNGFDSGRGGCIDAPNSSLILRDVTVVDCGISSGGTAEGGAIYLTSGTLMMDNCQFSLNYTSGADEKGGAVYLLYPQYVQITDSWFDRNDSFDGSAIFIAGTISDKPDLVVRGSTFIRNGRGDTGFGTAGWGGAIRMNGVQASISDSSFSDNNAINQGGAIMAEFTNLEIKRSIISGNGGNQSPGLYLGNETSFNLENNLFTDNQPQQSYLTSGVHIVTGASGSMKQTTIVGPGPEPRGVGVQLDGGSVVMENSLLARLNYGIRAYNSGTATADGILWASDGWSCDTHTHAYDGGSIAVSGEVPGDPGFADGAGGDFHITRSSVGRNAGIKAGVKKDLDRGSRDKNPDIGAYEYASKVAVTFPGKGEIVKAGSYYTVRWVAPTKAKKFTVKLSTNNGASWKKVAQNVTETRYDAWQAPVPWNNNKNCLIKVLAYDGSGAKVGSGRSRKFTIAVIRVHSPEKGTDMQSGDTETIYWETYATKRRVNRVILKYTVNGGKNWRTISPGPDPFDPLVHFWTVPDYDKTREKCRIKAILKSAAGKKVGVDSSDGWFTITPP